MDANQYCNSMYSELTAIRSKLYGIIRMTMEASPDEMDKEKASAKMSNLNQMADDLTTKIDKLKMECPADWSSEKEKIDEARGLINKEIDYWDAEHIPAGYQGG